MRVLEDRVLGIIGGIAVILFTNMITSMWSYDEGTKQANLAMWEKPPGMAWCRVYPDGGKRCEKYMVLPPKPLIECVRMCRAQDRMEKVK